jgi:hypothetical protein
MKQLKVLALAALVMLIAAPAFAADVEFSGQAAASLGYESVQSSTKNADPTATMGLGQDTAAELKASISEGNLSAEWAARVNASGVSKESGWVSYDFGAAQLKYKATGAEARWSGDAPYFGDSAAATLDVKAIDMIFVSIFDTGDTGFESTGSVVTAPVAATDPDGVPDSGDETDAVEGEYASVFPALSAGLDATFGPASVKAGLALEMYNDKDAAGESVSGVDAYTPMLFFVNTGLSFGSLSADVAFNYQMGGASTLTGGQKGGGKDGTAMGAWVKVAYSMGNMEFGDGFGWGTANDGNDDYTKMKLVDAYFKYSLDDNFSIKPKFYYETESSDAFGQDASSMKFAVDLGYSW